MIYLPTKNRPRNIERFITAYHRSGATLPVVLCINEGDKSYNRLELPDNFTVERFPARCVNDIHRFMFQKYPAEEFYAVLADDVIPGSPLWDIKLKAACLPGNLAWGADGLQNERLPTHPFMGGDFVRRMGFICPPRLKHWYADNIWLNFATAWGVGRYLKDVKLWHLHHLNHLSPMDETYASQPDTEEDRKTYEDFMANDFMGIVDGTHP